ncbi:hypothetical protein IMSAGC005_03942 [Lachnospiraceae bacterium]|nr:hypothetical protein IMSAGC005_03942 [Lachnospiraceae bacterium]
MVFIHAAVGKNHDIDAVPVRSVHFHEQSGYGAFKAGVLVVGNGNHLYFESVLLHALDLHQIRVGQDGIVHPEHVTILRYLFQYIAVSADINGGGCDHFLPDGIDRRVSHLCKQLLKVMEQRMMGLAQNRNRCVHAHRRNRLTSRLRHGKDTVFQLFIGVSKGFLHALSFFISKLRHSLIGNLQVMEPYQIAVQPFPVRRS